MWEPDVSNASTNMHGTSPSGHASQGHAAGRPLFDEDLQVLPGVTRRSEPGQGLRAQAAEHWLFAARMEYASVAAFARLSSELMALRAPLELVAECQRASLDEVRHTSICLQIANGLADDDEFAMGALAVVPARRDITVMQIAIEALLEGCIGEGSAAGWATLASSQAQPEYAEPLSTIASDELRHAGLSWRIVRWALSVKPTLSATLLAELGRWQREHHRTQPDPTERAHLEHLGVLSEATEYATTTELVRTIVRPTLERLCGGHVPDRQITGPYRST